MKTRDIHIDPNDDSSTIIKIATDGCCGYHQTIAGALLKSKEWKDWCREVSMRMHEKELREVYDIDETEALGCMGDEHWASFVDFLKSK